MAPKGRQNPGPGLQEVYIELLPPLCTCLENSLGEKKKKKKIKSACCNIAFHFPQFPQSCRIGPMGFIVSVRQVHCPTLPCTSLCRDTLSAVGCGCSGLIDGHRPSYTEGAGRNTPRAAQSGLALWACQPPKSRHMVEDPSYREYSGCNTMLLIWQENEMISNGQSTWVLLPVAATTPWCGSFSRPTPMRTLMVTMAGHHFTGLPEWPRRCSAFLPWVL